MRGAVAAHHDLRVSAVRLPRPLCCRRRARQGAALHLPDRIPEPHPGRLLSLWL